MKYVSNRTTLPLIAAVLATVSTAACGDRTDRPAGTGAPPTSTTTAPSNTAAPPAGAIAGPSITPPAVPPNPPGGPLAGADREFITLATSADMLEIDTGRLALDKSKNAALRTFAQKMIDDHTEASERLRQLASSVGVTPPAAMSSPHAAHLEKLRGLDGAEFDREYAAQIGVAGHQEAVGLFERASREATNPDVRAFAEKTLPTLREHLPDGQTLAKNVGVSADRLRMANAPPDLSSLSATISSGPTSTIGSGSTSGTDVSKSGTTTGTTANK